VKFAGAIALLFVLSVAGCGAKQPPATGKVTEAPPASAPSESPPAMATAAADALGQAIRAELGPDYEANYFAGRFDLNGDGQDEVVAYLAGPMVCGTGGCTVFVLTPSGSGYSLVGRISVAQTPIRVSPRVANGWRNLVIAIRGGGSQSANAELEFDGASYASNPTVPPAVPLVDLAGTEILVGDFQSYEDGIPVPPLVGSAAADTYGDPSTPLAGTVLGTTVHTSDAEELRYVVLQKLTDEYASDKGIVVTDEDKKAYVAHLEAVKKQDIEEKTAQRDALDQKLAAGGLSSAERASVTAERDSLDQFLKDIAEMDASPGMSAAELQSARQEIAGAFIRQWKINKALYEQYGGRVIFQQGGPEPLDAYRKFLEEHQARGDYEIVNEALEDEFWRYYRNDDLHSFYEAGSAEEAAAFSDPPWASN
jgi:hypothetical protein